MTDDQFLTEYFGCGDIGASSFREYQRKALKDIHEAFHVFDLLAPGDSFNEAAALANVRHWECPDCYVEGDDDRQDL